MAIRFNNVSGTSYVLDVSSLGLLPQLDVRDFRITHNSIDRTSAYTKTSATQLSYAGNNVVLGTVVQVTRATPLSVAEATFVGTTTAVQLTNAMTKLKRRVDELESLVNLQNALITSSGVSPGVLPISDATYSSAWDGDLSTAPSRNAVHDVISRIDTGANTWTGTYNLSGSSSVLVPTQSGSDRSTRASSTAQTQSAIDTRLRLVVNRTTSATITVGGFQTLPLNTPLVNLDNYDTTNFLWTCPSNGAYSFHMLALPISSGGTPPTKVNATAALQVGAAEIQIGATEIDGNFAYAVGSYTLVLTQGQTVRPRLLLQTTGGSGFTMTVGSNSNYLPQLVIYKLT